MSVLKLFIISLVMFLLSFVAKEQMEVPSENVAMASGNHYANSDNVYKFRVREDGQMMRFELKGTMPMNSWKAFDFEVYQSDGQYLFNYSDELWSESGRDSDGRWTEYKRYAYFDMRFPKQGEYDVYLTDSAKSNSKTANARYEFRVVPIRGDAGILKPVLYLFGAVAVCCFLILAHRAENDKDTTSSRYGKNRIQNKKVGQKSYVHIYTWCFAIGIFSLFFWLAYANDDDDIDYVHFSYSHSNIDVDRSIRQQSLSGSNYRAGSGKGGK